MQHIQLFIILNYLTIEYREEAIAIYPSRQSVFLSERCHNSAGQIFSRIASSQSQYKKILQALGANTRNYCLVEVIENGCIVTCRASQNNFLPLSHFFSF